MVFSLNIIGWRKLSRAPFSSIATRFANPNLWTWLSHSMQSTLPNFLPLEKISRLPKSISRITTQLNHVLCVPIFYYFCFRISMQVGALLECICVDAIKLNIHTACRVNSLKRSLIYFICDRRSDVLSKGRNVPEGVQFYLIHHIKLFK